MALGAGDDQARIFCRSAHLLSTDGMLASGRVEGGVVTTAELDQHGFIVKVRVGVPTQS